MEPCKGCNLAMSLSGIFQITIEDLGTMGFQETRPVSIGESAASTLCSLTGKAVAEEPENLFEIVSCDRKESPTITIRCKGYGGGKGPHLALPRKRVSPLSETLLFIKLSKKAAVWCPFCLTPPSCFLFKLSLEPFIVFLGYMFYRNCKNAGSFIRMQFMNFFFNRLIFILNSFNN